MNKNILQILEKSTLLFNSDENYAKFQLAVLECRFQVARYYLDVEMEHNRDLSGYEQFTSLYSEVEDLLMDLVINEIDGGEGSNKQLSKNIRS